MSASSLIQPSTQVVSFSVAVTGASTVLSGGIPNQTGFFQLKHGEGYYAELQVATSTGTVDIALQHSTDGGTTWKTLPLKFTQSAAAGSVSALAFKAAIGLSDAAAAVAPALTGTAAAANIPFNLKMVRAYATLGTPGATTFNIAFNMTPKGSVVQ